MVIMTYPMHFFEVFFAFITSLCNPLTYSFSTSDLREGGREGRREGGREGGEEGGRGGGREGEREGWREGGKEGEREGGREGEREREDFPSHPTKVVYKQEVVYMLKGRTDTYT